MGYVIIKQGDELKTGDTGPSLTIQCIKENDNPEDLSSINEVSVFITEADESTLKVDDNTGGNVSVSDAASGEVTYDWQSGDTDNPGTYRGEVEVDFTSGETKTFPSAGTFKVYIEEGLN